MAITNKNRKILWSKAGNQCAICGQNLIMAIDEKNTVIGEECHIISPKEKGPRFRIINDYDDYFNLILLCSVHHKLIDDNEEVFTEKILHNLKKAHEKKIENQLKEENRLGIILFKADSVRDLIRSLDGAEQIATDYPVECEKDYSLFAEFFNLVHNFDILDDYDEFYRMSIYKDIFKKIEDSGYVILLGIDEKYGKNKLKTVFVFIRTIDDYQENKIELGS